MITILPCDPKANYQAHKKEIDIAVERVLNSGRYILGKEVEFVFAMRVFAGIGEKTCVLKGFLPFAILPSCTDSRESADYLPVIVSKSPAYRGNSTPSTDGMANRVKKSIPPAHRVGRGQSRHASEHPGRAAASWTTAPMRPRLQFVPPIEDCSWGSYFDFSDPADTLQFEFTHGNH